VQSDRHDYDQCIGAIMGETHTLPVVVKMGDRKGKENAGIIGHIEILHCKSAVIPNHL
jgi:hypothetical protein